MAVSYKARYTLTLWATNCAPMYIPKRNENVHPQKDLFANIHSGFIHGQKSSIWWMDKQIVV